MKPIYGKYLTSAEFQNRSDAERWAKDTKKTYKEAEMSIKFDIARTPSSGWKATLWVKV